MARAELTGPLAPPDTSAKRTRQTRPTGRRPSGRRKTGKSRPKRGIPRLEEIEAHGVALSQDPANGEPEVAYVAAGDDGVWVVDVSEALETPKSKRDEPYVLRASTTDARDVTVSGDSLLVADGAGGLALFDISSPKKPRKTAAVRTVEARSVTVAGFRAYVADGPAGLRILDVSEPEDARVVGTVDLNGEVTTPNDACDLVVAPLPARPDSSERGRSRFRLCAFVADGAGGLRIVDVTNESKPSVLSSVPGVYGRAIAFATRWDAEGESGPPQERSYAFLISRRGTSASSSLHVIDVTDPMAPDTQGVFDIPCASDVAVAQSLVGRSARPFPIVVCDDGVVHVFDASRPGDLREIATVEGGEGAAGIALVELPLDRIVNEAGDPVRGMGTFGAKPLSKEDMLRVMRAKVKFGSSLFMFGE